MSERYRYTLSTLTPVHIGTGETMLPMEFQVSEDSMQMWVPELERVFLKYPNAVRSFSNRLTSNPNMLTRKTAGELLENVKLSDPSILKYSTFNPSSNNYCYNGLKILKQQIKSSTSNVEVRLATKTPDYRVYLPGSSIKGAIKTAWAYAACKSETNLVTAVGRESRSANRKVQEIFQGLNDKANYDLFRVLHVGDSEPKPASEALCVTGVRVLSAAVRPKAASVEANWKNYWVFCESIVRETQHTGYLTLQTELLENPTARRELGWKPEQNLSIGSLCENVNTFARDICEWEMEYFKKIIQREGQCEFKGVINQYEYIIKQIGKAQNNTCYLSIGYGSGWHKMTIGLLLEKQMKPEDFKRLRNDLNLARNYTDFEYPKSRKLIMIGENKATYPFGWVKLQFERVQ